MTELLKDLCKLAGPSGYEDEVREYIKEKATAYADEMIEDVMGNLLIYKKGRRRAEQRLMLAAHMDEVGVIVTSIGEDGYLKFSFIGGIDRRVVLNKRVYIGDKRQVGVIGIKAAHLTEEAERRRIPKLGELYIDIGAGSRTEAEGQVKLGDYGVFESGAREMEGGYIKGKAIDDRIGCAIMLRLIQEEIGVDTWFAFTVQEEVGCRGAGVAARRLKPDKALIIEGTTAADLPTQKGGDKVCVSGGGAVITYMDAGTLYDRGLYRELVGIAEERGLKWQTKTYISGGTDAQQIQRSGTGVRTAGVSAPVRYIHTPCGMVKRADMEMMYELIKAYIERQ